MPGLGISLFFHFAQMRKEQDVPDGMFIGQQHRQAVHPHAEAAAGRHAVAHCAQVILVHGMFFFILCTIVSPHFKKTLLLVEGIVQLGKGVSQLETRGVALEAFHGDSLTRDHLCQGGDVTRVIVEECWLDQDWLKIL